MTENTSSIRSVVVPAIVGACSAIVVGILGLIGVSVTGWFSYASKDEELHIHLVEIAIGILRADPKEDVAPARGWATDVIDKYSGVPFSNEDKAALLHKSIKSAPFVSLSPSTLPGLEYGGTWSPSAFSCDTPECRKTMKDLLSSQAMKDLVESITKGKAGNSDEAPPK